MCASSRRPAGIWKKWSPLRERHEDFALLADYLVDAVCRNQGMPPRGISAGAINRLCRHDWPGNVRELANVLERALLMSDSDTLEADDLEAVMPAAPLESPKVVSLRPVGMAEAVAQAEREAIRLALQSARGNKAEAVRQLGISRAALYEKMAALGVDAQLA